LIVVTTTATAESSNTLILQVAVAAGSTLMILLGLLPSYRLYISQKASAEGVISKNSILKSVHGFLWNRWYMEAFYNKVFVDGALAAKDLAVRFIEKPLDLTLNVGIPRGFAGLHRSLKKVQTGILSVNMLFFIGLIVALLIAFLLLGAI
jgi:NADH-quinone oxidoreductase subunit L